MKWAVMILLALKILKSKFFAKLTHEINYGRISYLCNNNQRKKEDIFLISINDSHLKELPENNAVNLSAILFSNVLILIDFFPCSINQ